ncbi:MAG TPA: NifU N-terminal domain-containing protein [Thermohalobaculum sp.]|nr:NifU N-terminal domain-containing protein [Thermohalobaculum sp.]
MALPAIQVQGTPNPNAAKFVLGRSLLGDEGRTYFNAEAAEGNPLAERLFEVEGVRALFLVDNFITVTKTEGASWDDLVEPIREVIAQELGA